MIKDIYHFLKAKIKIETLAKVIAILLIIYLFSLTDGIFKTVSRTVYDIIKPFIFGFVIAYVSDPFIKWFENRHIKRGIIVPLLWIIIIVVMIAFFLILIPMLYSKLNGFINSMIASIEWISNQIILIANYEDFSLINTITSTLTGFLESYEDWLPQIVSNIPAWMSLFLDFITDSLFTIIIAIYFQFDFTRIKKMIKMIAKQIYDDSEDYLREIDIDVQVYLKSMIIMILIRMFEYSLFYFILGHNDWFIIGFITAIACVIPYIGGTTANVLGILTGLTLEPMKLVILVVGLVLLSNIDGYIISPAVHKKRSALNPLLSLLVIFAGGGLLGIVGIMISLPLVIAIRSCFEVYERKNGKLFD